MSKDTFMKEFDYEELIKRSNLEREMTVDLVVDLFNVTKQSWLVGRKFDANNFIDAVCDYIGANGTVLVRAFNWDFCHGATFDIRSMPSRAGALGNVVMKRGDFMRTRHPLYSWYVKGRDAKYLCELDNRDAFGKDSVFAWEHHNPYAVQLNIGNPSTNGITLFHYMEEQTNVSYRYKKNFTGKYIDYEGNETIQTYSMYVRDLGYHITTNDEVYMDELIQKGIRLDGEYEGIKTQLYKIPELCDIYEKDFKKTGIPSGVTLEKV